jgi:hypothetical protein
VHGDDLPDLLSAISTALTLVVIWFAWRTVGEARAATAEQKETVTALRSLIDVTGQLATASRDSLDAARQTASLAADAGQDARERRAIETLQTMARTVEKIRTQADEACRTLSGTAESKWSCRDQVALQFQMIKLPVTLRSCDRLYRTTGAREVREACPDARAQIEAGLAGLGAGIQ